MNKKSLDKLFRERLRDDQAPVDNKAWEKMRALLDNEMTEVKPIDTFSKISSFGFLKSIFIIVAFTVVCFTAFYSTKWLAKKDFNNSNNTNTSAENKSTIAHPQANTLNKYTAESQATGSLHGSDPHQNPKHPQIAPSLENHKDFANHSGDKKGRRGIASKNGHHAKNKTQLPPEAEFLANFDDVSNKTLATLSSENTLMNYINGKPMINSKNEEMLTKKAKSFNRKQLDSVYARSKDGFDKNEFGVKISYGNGMLINADRGNSSEFGLYYRRKLNEKFSVQGEATFSSQMNRNFKASYLSVTYTDLVDTMWEDVTVQSIYYIKVPLSLRYNLNRSFSISAGAYFSYQLASQYFYKQDHADQFYNRFTTLTSIGVATTGSAYSKGIQKTDYGLNFGVEYRPIPKLGISLGATIGLNDVTDNKYYSNTRADYNSTLNMSISYRLR
jgi:hypothetical protein